MEFQNLENITEQKLFPYKDLFPKIDNSVFLASGVKIVGDVSIGKNSSVWYNCVIRGDVHYVKIGDGTNIQDLSMLHVTNNRFPLNIGNNVTIGHSVKLHGCTIQDLSLIGIGAIVLDGAVVEENSLVAAGTVIKPGFIVPSGKLVAGVPGKVIRDLTVPEMEDFEASALRYQKYTEITINSLKKSN
ncbi:MAG: gamma carbonic anhydrase family protein [Ignavibacteriae bacterium]|nr:gamma carbonic anhydrase family protein [Ignavibacteriota bacterium]MCB9209850.1 gamma carbonic anhydrase family protein [Ignavibacteriales bacterium]MCB9219007.1 gamma carbonic anhydrase family protein [Ignavibacteriales bacterium]